MFNINLNRWRFLHKSIYLDSFLFFFQIVLTFNFEAQCLNPEQLTWLTDLIDYLPHTVDFVKFVKFALRTEYDHESDIVLHKGKVMTHSL